MWSDTFETSNWFRFGGGFWFAMRRNPICSYPTGTKKGGLLSIHLPGRTSAFLTVRWVLAVALITSFGARTLTAEERAADEGRRPQPEVAVSYDPAHASDFDRSYDYFPPLRPGGATVLFVQSRFWSERQPDALVLRGLVKGVIQAGHAAFVIRHRTGAEAVHPGPIEDVARAFAHARRRIEAAGADLSRVFVFGHSSGAQLALALGLDPRWLAAHDLTPDSIAGVAAISGILDLASDAIGSPEEAAYYDAAFPSKKARRASSPIAMLDRERPPILVLTAANDIPGYARAAERFVARAREVGRGSIERFIATGRDHYSILDFATRSGEPHWLHLLESRPREGELPEMWQVASTWRNPPFSTEPFHTRFGALVRELDVDERFTEIVNRPFVRPPGTPPRLRFGRYAAIELSALLEAMSQDATTAGALGRGDWLEITNVRGEKAFFPVARLEALGAHIVVGVDGERNLFRATDVYHTRRRYSWTDAEARRVDMARPLGGFLFFPGEEPGRDEAMPLFGRYGLTLDSFRRVRGDPRAVYADLPPRGREILTEQHHCVSCHRFREVGGRALHIRARDGEPMGGHALPLERYPAAVFKRFVFEQDAVAEEVGANAVRFTPEEAQALYQMVVDERERRGVTPWSRPERDRTQTGSR